MWTRTQAISLSGRVMPCLDRRFDLRYSLGRLAIDFLRKNSSIGATRVVDLQGNAIATYSADDKMDAALPLAGVQSSTRPAWVAKSGSRGNTQLR